MRINKRDLILGAVILISSIILLFESYNIPEGPLDHMVGGFASPRGFIGMFLYALMFLSSLLIVSSLKASPEKEGTKVTRRIVRIEVVYLMIALILYIATLGIFGFNLGSFLLLMFFITFLQLKEHNLTMKNKKQFKNIIFKAFVITITTLVLLNVVFVNLLYVTLPRGIFGF